MNGTAFIRMMRDDIETHKDKERLSQVVDLMEYVVSLHPNCEIAPNKSVEECYKKLFDYASRNRNGENSVCLVPSKSIEIATEYLGLTSSTPAVVPGTPHVVLEDFL